MLFIIRHGKTDMNSKMLMQGRSDYPLNMDGIVQAEEAAERFADMSITIDKVYASPLKRALQTAEIISLAQATLTMQSVLDAHDQPRHPEERSGEGSSVPAPDVEFAPEITIDGRLIEMDYGPYEGMDLRNPAPEVMDFFMDFVNVPAPEGMEPLDSVVARLGEFLEDIKGEASSKNILISTHAIAMKGALEYLTPDSGGSYWSKNIGNCDIYATDIINGAYTVPHLIDDGKDRWEAAR